MYLVSIIALFALGAFSYLFQNLPLLLFIFVVSCLYSAFFTPLASNRKTFVGVESALIASLLLYGFFVPFHEVMNSDGNFQLILKSLFMYQMAITGLAVGLVIVGFLLRENKISRQQPIYNEKSSAFVAEKYSAFVVLFWGAGVAFLAVLFTVGFDAYLNAGYAGRALIKRQAGPIELGLYHAVVGALLLFAIANINGQGGLRQGNLKRFVFIFFIFFIVYVSFLGIRRPTFFLVISFFAFYVRQISGLQFRYIVALVLVFFCFTLFAQFRQVLAADGAAAAASFVKENSSVHWLDMSSTELGAPFRVLLDVQDHWNGEPARLGYSYYQAFINILPRQFGIDIVSLSEEYTYRLFTADFRAIGGNMGFSPVAEAYLNFGFWGILLMFAFWGCLWGGVSVFLDSRSHILAQVFSAVLIPWSMFFCRTDFAAYIKVSFYSIGIPFVIFILANLVIKNFVKHRARLGS
ncbi:MAG: oligosaccharide repeat unit polymerase [Alcanivorax sp.]|jgi:oligosaccharide repeat unit polymerase